MRGLRPVGAPVEDTGALFTALAARLGAVYEAERAALDRLRAAPV